VTVEKRERERKRMRKIEKERKRESGRERNGKTLFDADTIQMLQRRCHCQKQNFLLYFTSKLFYL
jgi:hypothetical protein